MGLRRLSVCADSHEPHGVADGSIHIAPQMWPSGSAKSRPYMNPCSSTGLMSAVPPCSAAALFIASTCSRESHEIFSATSLDVFGGMGRVVNVLHFACVKS